MLEELEFGKFAAIYGFIGGIIGLALGLLLAKLEPPAHIFVFVCPCLGIIMGGVIGAIPRDGLD